jgi:hypothetical protein
MYAVEKSDSGVVPVKASNKIGQPSAKRLEERPLAKGKFLQLIENRWVF